MYPDTITPYYSHSPFLMWTTTTAPKGKTCPLASIFAALLHVLPTFPRVHTAVRDMGI